MQTLMRLQGIHELAFEQSRQMRRELRAKWKLHFMTHKFHKQALYSMTRWSRCLEAIFGWPNQTGRALHQRKNSTPSKARKYCRQCHKDVTGHHPYQEILHKQITFLIVIEETQIWANKIESSFMFRVRNSKCSQDQALVMYVDLTHDGACG